MKHCNNFTLNPIYVSYVHTYPVGLHGEGSRGELRKGGSGQRLVSTGPKRQPHERCYPDDSAMVKGAASRRMSQDAAFLLRVTTDQGDSIFEDAPLAMGINWAKRQQVLVRCTPGCEASTHQRKKSSTSLPKQQNKTNEKCQVSQNG